jgi:RNA-binding protein 39
MNSLYQVFEPFGQVELVQLPLDPLTGLCKGFGFVQFARLEDAKAAQSLNGQLDIAGRVIKVSAVTDQAGVQVSGVTTGDLDDDEGGGLVGAISGDTSRTGNSLIIFDIYILIFF